MEFQNNWFSKLFILQLEAQTSTWFDSQFPQTIDHSTLTLFLLVIGPAGGDSLEKTFETKHEHLAKIGSTLH